MPKPPIIALLALLVLPVALACDASGGGSGEQGVDSGTTAVPAAVLDIEADAEDAIDMVFAGNWVRVASDADSIAENWSDFTASEEGADVNEEQRAEMARAILALYTSASAEDGLAARQAANDVSKVIVDVFDLFDVTIPTDIGRLDWLERQVIIDAERQNWDAVRGDLNETRAKFDHVRDDVSEKGGDKEVSDYEASLTRQDELAASQDAAIIDEATVALELVDELEQVY
jgi:hypothetical protein